MSREEDERDDALAAAELSDNWRAVDKVQRRILKLASRLNDPAKREGQAQTARRKIRLFSERIERIERIRAESDGSAGFPTG